MKMTCGLESEAARFAPVAMGGGTGVATAGEMHALNEGDVTSWPIRFGRRTFEVLRGTVWLTCENRAEDFLLHEGERLTIGAPGKVVAQSLLGSARIAVRNE